MRLSPPPSYLSFLLSVHERGNCHPKWAGCWPPDARRPSAPGQVDGPKGSRCQGHRAVAGSLQRPVRGARGGTEADTRSGTTRRSPEGLPAQGPPAAGTDARNGRPPKPAASTVPPLHSRPPRTDRINPRGWSHPGLALRGGPQAAGRRLACHGRQKPPVTRPGPRAGLRLPREASASSLWPSRPLRTRETCGTSVACSDPPKEKPTASSDLGCPCPRGQSLCRLLSQVSNSADFLTTSRPSHGQVPVHRHVYNPARPGAATGGTSAL